MELDLACVSDFLVLVEENHFGRAATRLHLTSSALTKRIQRLEKQLGVKLHHQGASGRLALTAGGVRFASDARSLLAHARAARQAARTEPPRWTIRLGVIGTIGELPRRALLRQLADRLRTSHPDVTLRAQEALPIGSLNDSLHSGQVDVGLTISTEDPYDDLSFTPFRFVDRVALVAREHPLAAAAAVSAETICSYPMIYDPSIPTDWMAPLCLGDYRPFKEAKLVPINAVSAKSVFSRLADRHSVTVTDNTLIPPVFPGLRLLPLLDAPKMEMLLAHRRRDRREPIHALVQAIGTAFAGNRT